MTYNERYAEWLEKVTEPELKRELEAMADDEGLKEERFYTEVSFGTAGMRGVLGAGTNCMNVCVVRRATAGLAKYLLNIPGADGRGVAIAYDSRHMSREFAWETARTLAAYGIKVYVYETLHSVPQLSFAVRYRKCIAGVVITASHNPPEYNGYKVYWEHGGQVAPEQADGIFAAISQESYFDVRTADKEANGRITVMGADVDEAYYRAAEGLLLCGDLLKRSRGRLKLVYTPLFGTGCVPMRALMKRQGMELTVVEEQSEPNGDFPGLSAPNPENPGAFELAKSLAREVGANVIFATDPDADRLGVALKAGEDFELLSGNRIACLLLHYILSVRSENGTLPKDGFIVRSLVSTRMADAIAAHYGVKTETVPTGFRFISERIDESERTGRGSFLFGFEESYGYLAGGGSRDKDAISSAMLLCEAAAYYAKSGKTLADVMEDMFALYGAHGESVYSFTLPGKEGIERIKSAMARLREAPPKRFGNAGVRVAEDLQSGVRTEGDEVKKADFSGLDVLVYTLDNGAWLCVRPSGTEPKLKLYIGARAANTRQLAEELDGIRTAAVDALDKLLNA